MNMDFLTAIDEKQEELIQLADTVWGYAETAFKEYKSFEALTSYLKKNGFSGWIGVEPFDYSDGPDVLCKNSIDYLKSVG